VATHWWSDLLTYTLMSDLMWSCCCELRFNTVTKYILMTWCGPAAVNWDSTLWHSSSWWVTWCGPAAVNWDSTLWHSSSWWPAVVLLLWIEIQHSDTVPLYLLHLITKLITVQHKAYTWWWTSHHRRPSSCRRVYVCDAVLLVVWRVFILRLLGCDCE